MRPRCHTARSKNLAVKNRQEIRKGVGISRLNPVPKDQYTNDAYNQAIERACEKAGVPKWTPNQLRHNAGTDTAANFSMEAAKEFFGHSSIKTTEKYYVAPLPELAAKVAREIG